MAPIQISLYHGILNILFATTIIITKREQRKLLRWRRLIFVDSNIEVVFKIQGFNLLK